MDGVPAYANSVVFPDPFDGSEGMIGNVVVPEELSAAFRLGAAVAQDPLFQFFHIVAMIVKNAG